MSWSRWLAAGALAAALAYVFVDQPRDDGFRRGHRGWVSSHTLAIVEKSVPENGFVGYTMSLRTEKGRDLYYFDRYPVFFAAALEALEDAFASGPAEEIRIARQAMNAIYAATLVVAVLLLVELGLSIEAAVAATALAGASETMVAYRDMVHFDQPAVLGIALLLWSIARFRRGGSGALVVAMSCVAVSLGRGYACFAALGAWWIFENAPLLWKPAEKRCQTPFHTSGFAAAVRRIAAGVPTRACLAAIAIGALCLGYNVVMESRIRGVPVADVGIIASAKQRLSLDEGFNERNEKRLTWSSVLSGQQGNVAHGVLPFVRHDPIKTRPWLRQVVASLVLVVAIGFAATRPSPIRAAWLTAVAAGPIWLLAMRNLAAFHPYTAIYLFPLCLTFFAALLVRLPRQAALGTALASAWLLTACTSSSNRAILQSSDTSRQDTRDMAEIEKVLGPGDAVATEKQIFRGVPYAFGFYLPDHDVIVEGPATLVVTRRRRFDGENLTPRNAGIYLFRPDDAYFARSSLARHHRGSTAAHKVKVRHETGRKRGKR